MVIAYGNSPMGTCFNDCWSFSLTDVTWVRREYALLSPRTRAASIRIGRALFVFGGVCDSVYFSDLHSIDLDTGVLTRYDCACVSPRCRAHLFASADALFIYGGFNGRTIDSLHELSLRDWSAKTREHTDCGGRPGASVARGTDGFFYVFGDTSGHPLLRFRAEERTFEVMKCGGLAPPADLTDAMVAAFGNNCLIIVGGDRESNHTYVYGLSIERAVWFTVGVLPDGVSVTLADGNVKNGLFQLPRQHSAAFAYSAKRRAIVSVMGSNFLEPPPVNTIALGDAIAVLNLKWDLLAML
jgi:hypothetical protein